MPMAYFHYALEVDHRIGTRWPIFTLSSTYNSHVSLDFCLEKNASIFLVFFAPEN